MTNSEAKKMVGCSVFHDGEHGVIEAYDTRTYRVPMFRVRFGTRMATLKPTEIGSK